MADLIILGWPKRTGFMDKLIGEKVDHILKNTDKSIFISLLEKPLAVHKKIIVAVPPLAEHEKGFEHWLGKVAKLAQELTIPVQLYCNDVTKKAVEKVLKITRISAAFSFTFFSDWDDFLILARHIQEDDLVILVSARKGTLSHIPILENLPGKLEKYFPLNSLLIIYPQQFSNSHVIERFEDINAEPLSKGIETIQKIGKGLGSIFKRKSPNR